MAYTSIDDPSAYFQTALWTGTNAKDKVITNDGNSNLQPDLIWAKSRTSTSYTDNHFIVDSSRGRTKGIVPNATSAETTTTGNATQQAERDLQSFDTNGFTVGIVNSTAALNAQDASLVGWQWKANGGTTSSNTDGSITSTVQADTDAGFSIVTWTGNGTSGATVGHGLGVKPSHIIIRNRSTSNINWTNYASNIGATKFLQLNKTTAETTATNRFNDTEPTTSVFSLGDSSRSNGNTSDMIAYCFAEKQGYSKFGQYIGNGNADGPFVYTGFKPAFIMGKRTNTTGNWFIMDSAREPNNVMSRRLMANTSDAESNSTTYYTDFLSNGFKLRTNVIQSNASGSTYTFLAFAENPFVTSTGIPTTAR